MMKLRTCALFTFFPARSRSKVACTVFLFCAAAVITSPAQTFKTLVNFDGTNGSYTELRSLVQGTDGDFYGTTSNGGANDYGTVFKVTAKGKLTTLHSFDNTDGAGPWAGLVQAHNGDFYGTTAYGGANGYGTVFKITPEGKLTTLYSFCSLPNCSDGASPASTLVQATDGDFYGTASAYATPLQVGTVFKITPRGKFTILYTFCSLPNCTDGRFPVGGLMQATDGDFYGTAASGGAYGYGTVFKISAEGKLTTLHSFDGIHGSEPYEGPLVQATDGDFYGTTIVGGGKDYGTVFKITPGGKLTTLHSFCSLPGCGDGYYPYAGVVQATDGNFYGTTYGGGNSESCLFCGTVFKITREGRLTTLHSFDSTDGIHPSGGLLQATNGDFYGTTPFAGNLAFCEPDGCGTVFSLSVGLGPFVETEPTSGKVRAKVIILGNKLTGTTSVTFNGTEAPFDVVSSTEIKTRVPTGATTGTVEVSTSSGTLKSNVAFRVTK